ncbi:spore germination protein [Halalkalibacter urbisdiaboli]|uniref:spore germination protein n=1 Tax=Halalkalibacter urbisdiaboli TaxID=1960589 RepID=UPI000B44EE94|nr:spore germination protein [Halalkalibacter urbisdiaboli]
MNFIKNISKLKGKHNGSKRQFHSPKNNKFSLNKVSEEAISENVDLNKTKIKEIFKSDMDLIIRGFQTLNNKKAVVVFIQSLVNKEVINRDILEPLMNFKLQDHSLNDFTASNTKNEVLTKILHHNGVSCADTFSNVVNSILLGCTVVIIDDLTEAFIIDTHKQEKRSITQPEQERVIRGPREGFIEQLDTNISLLRYRLPVPDFRIKEMAIGEITKSKVVVLFLENIANGDLVKEVENRLQQIQIDRILDSGYIEELIQDNPKSPFPQIQNTERPDKVVGALLEGRVAIMVNGSPFALIAPATFNQFLQTVEDYNERSLYSSLIRMIRQLSLILSFVIPSVYVAVISFHPELIPTRYMVAVTGGRAGVPVIIAIEVFLMEIIMEVLREATIRMPQLIGGALSIVGVLIIGQASVEAGFISPFTVVIIALTTLSSFTTPAYNLAVTIRILRFPLLIFSSAFGLFGLMMCLILIINHMLSLKSFGLPYMSPFSPSNWDELKDSFIRSPIRWLLDRPESLRPKNRRRATDIDFEHGEPLDDSRKRARSEE